MEDRTTWAWERAGRIVDTVEVVLSAKTRDQLQKSIAEELVVVREEARTKPEVETLRSAIAKKCGVVLEDGVIEKGIKEARSFLTEAVELGSITSSEKALGVVESIDEIFDDRSKEEEAIASGSFVDIVFDGPPGPESGRFVESENSEGKSIRLGEWIEREDGFWTLRINLDRRLVDLAYEVEEVLGELDDFLCVPGISGPWARLASAFEAATGRMVEVDRREVEGQLARVDPSVPGTLTLDDYQRMAGTTAIYPGTRGFIGLLYCALGLAGEAGEVANQAKKALRDDEGRTVCPVRAKAIRKELGDVLWYAARVAYEIGAPLSRVASENLEKLRSRAERGKVGGEGDDR